MSKSTLSNKTRFLALLGAAALTLSACAAPVAQEAAAPAPAPETAAEAGPQIAPPAYLAASGVIRYCATLDNPPRGSLDEGSRPVGFEVELGKEMAALMDLRVQWVQLQFAAIIPALQANQCDAIVQELFIREARLEIIDMIPFSNTGQRLVGASGAQIAGKTLADLGGLTIAVPNGTSIAGLVEEANAALKAAGKPLIKVQVLPTTTDTFAALDAGTVDVVGTTTTAAAYYVGLNPEKFEFLGDAFGLIETGFGINKDNPELTAALQKAFDQLVEDGTYDRLIAEFNMGGSEL